MSAEADINGGLSTFNYNKNNNNDNNKSRKKHINLNHSAESASNKRASFGIATGMLLPRKNVIAIKYKSSESSLIATPVKVNHAPKTVSSCTSDKAASLPAKANNTKKYSFAANLAPKAPLPALSGNPSRLGSRFDLGAADVNSAAATSSSSAAGASTSARRPASPREVLITNNTNSHANSGAGAHCRSFKTKEQKSKKHFSTANYAFNALAASASIDSRRSSRRQTPSTAASAYAQTRSYDSYPQSSSSSSSDEYFDMVSNANANSFFFAEVPTRSFYDAQIATLKKNNGSAVVLSRLVFQAGTTPAAHTEITEYNKQAQIHIRNRMQQIQQIYEPITGICVAYPQVVLYVVESTEAIVVEFYKRIEALTKVSLVKTTGVRNRTTSRISADIVLEPILTNVLLLAISSNIRGRSFPNWATRSFNVAKAQTENLIAKEHDLHKVHQNVVASVIKLGEHLTRCAKSASEAKSAAEKQRTLENALKFTLVSPLLPSYDLLMLLDGSEPTEGRLDFLMSLVTKGAIVEEKEEESTTFPFYWEEKKFQGIPCCLNGMKHFPEVISTRTT